MLKDSDSTLEFTSQHLDSSEHQNCQKMKIKRSNNSGITGNHNSCKILRDKMTFNKRSRYRIENPLYQNGISGQMILLILTMIITLSNGQETTPAFEFQPRSMASKCDTRGMFPVFYGGVYNNFIRNVDVSDDGKYILFCGESYSYYNFVNKTIEGYLMMVNSNDGSYVWGNYYQTTDSSASTYMGLINTCKFDKKSQRIVITGQVNFYKSFVGQVSITDGSILKGYLMQTSNSNSNYRVSYSGNSVEIDSSFNMYGGVYFLSSTLTMYKISKNGDFDWTMQIGYDTSDLGLSSSSPPVTCMDPSQKYLYVGWSTVHYAYYNTTNYTAYTNGTIFQLRMSNGKMSWFKKQNQIDRVSQLQCLDNGGAIGCGVYAATSFVISVDEDGKQSYNYMFTGDNPESCLGIVYQSSTFYVLIETASTDYTSSGYTDAVVIQFELNGKMRRGRYLTLKGNLNLGRGLSRMSDGSFVFGGSSKKAIKQNFQYHSMFIQRVEIFSNDRSCISLSDMPSNGAISYKENYGNLTNIKDTLNPNMWATEIRNITIKEITNLTAYPLKNIYKQYQPCIFFSFYNPYEYLDGDTTVIINPSSVISSSTSSSTGQTENNSSKPFNYYLGENTSKSLNDWLYLKMKSQSMTVTLMNGNSLPSFMSYSNDKLTINTNSTSNIGTYIIKFTGCYGLKTGTYYQTVNILPNTAPYANFTKKNYTFSIKSSWQIIIPPIQDKESNSQVTSTVRMSSSSQSLPYFITFDSKNNIINVKPLSYIDVGNYTVIVKLYENNAPSYYTEYTINIQIVTSLNNTSNYYNASSPSYAAKTNPLKGHLTTKSKDGSIKIQWNQDIAIPPQSYELMKSQGFINITLDGPSAPYKYTWSISTITAKYILFQLKFENPGIIGLYKEDEKVNITFIDLLIQTVNTDDNNFLTNRFYQQELSIVIDSSDSSLESLSKVSSTMKSMLSTVMGASLLSQTVISNALSNLWSLIHTLQLITYMGFFNVNLPAHVAEFYDMLMVSHFDALPFKDEIYDAIQEQNVFFQPYNSNMELFGNDSTIVMINLTDIWIASGMMMGFFLVYRLGLTIYVRSKTTRFGFAKRYFEHQIQQFKYNAIIRTFIEAYLDIALYSFVALVVFSLDDKPNIISTVMSFVFFVNNKKVELILLQGICLAAIPIIVIYTEKRRLPLQDEKSKEWIQTNTIVRNMQIKRKLGRHFIALYMIRRIYFCILFAIPEEHVVVQLSLNLVHCVIQCIYMVVVRPYDAAKINLQEIVNEFTILTVACLFFGFCDVIPDYETKMRIGWAVIFVILGNLLFNIIILTIEIILGIRRFIRAWREKRRKDKYQNPEDSKETINKFIQNKNNPNSKVLDDVTMQDFMENEESKVEDDFDNIKKPGKKNKKGKKENFENGDDPDLKKSPKPKKKPAPGGVGTVSYKDTFGGSNMGGNEVLKEKEEEFNKDVSILDSLFEKSKTKRKQMVKNIKQEIFGHHPETPEKREQLRTDQNFIQDQHEKTMSVHESNDDQPQNLKYKKKILTSQGTSNIDDSSSDNFGGYNLDPKP